MPSRKQPRFRPTLWPGTPVDPGAIDAGWRARAVGERLELEHDVAFGTDPYRAVEPEVYLRAIWDTDEFDPESLASLTNSEGSMVERDLESDLPGDRETQAAILERFAATAGWRYERPDADNARGPRADDSVHVVEVAFRVYLVKCLVRHLIAHRDGGDVVAAWSLIDGRPNERIQTDEDAWRWFADFANAALGAFQVHVTVHRDTAPVARATVPNLYQVAVLQLVNDWSLGVEYSICANETCGRRFGRQLGRAQYEQHRLKGVKYCSRSCARAQAERERRRKLNKEARNG
jgi:hypothetical protein